MILYFFNGFSAPDLVEELPRWVPQNGVVLDVGAAYGTHAIHYARHVVPAGHVWALEPVERSFRQLERNVQLNRLTNVSCVPSGLSDRNDDRTLAIPDAGVHPRYRPTTPWSRTAGLMSVHATASASGGEASVGHFTTLDAFVESRRLASLDLMKVDVEGHELAVLNGGVGALRRFRPVIVMEFNAVTCQLAGVAAADLLARLSELGYQPFVKNKSGQLMPLEGAMLGDGSFARGIGIPFLFNALLVPSERVPVNYP